MRLGEPLKNLNREKFKSSNMMHYAPWAHQQIMMENQRYYAQYMEDLSHYHHRSEPIEEDSEQTGDEMPDTMTSATSGERSSSADIFRLEFAATQWSKLVSNAEGLFNKLIVSNILPHTEQDQIEQWLCLKQEYEECITSDDTASFQGLAENARRSLEIIEEVTETDDKTDESGNRLEYQDTTEISSESESEMSEKDDEDEDQSDTNSENPDFMEKLDEYMKKFKAETDKFIELKKDEIKDSSIPIISSLPQIAGNNNDSAPIIKPIPRRNPNMRRNTMLPGSEMSNDLLAFNENLKLTQSQHIHMNSSNSFTASKYTEMSHNLDIESGNINDEIPMRAQVNNPQNLLMSPLGNSDSPGPINILKTLTKNNKTKQKEILKIQSDLQGAYKRIEELQSTIQIKERFIAEMIKNSDTRASAQHRCQRKTVKLKEEFHNTKTQLAQAQSAFRNNNTGERAQHKKEIEQYENKAFHYQKKLVNLKKIAQIAEDSVKKVSELESSLFASKQQMEELKRQLQKEERLKKHLQDEVAEDQRKIRDLKEKYTLTASKLKEIQSESEEEIAKSRSENTGEKSNLLDVRARISHIDHILKEKSMDLDKIADSSEKEVLRLEIQNLRNRKDSLVDKQAKLMNEQPWTTDKEWTFLECREAIEVIDVIMERKNEMICGRNAFGEGQDHRVDGEPVLECLAKLTEGEMKNIFQKYFMKVIDLKETLKNLDEENKKLIAHNDNLEKHIQYLVHHLEEQKMQSEKRVVVMQQNFERNKTTLLKHIAENSSSSDHEKDSEIAKCYKKIKALQRKLQETENLKSLAPKVTREKNKLIIQKK